MAFQVVGTKIKDLKGNLIESGAKTHREATHAAQEAAKSGSSVVVEPTVFAEITLDFDGAEDYVEILDENEVRGAMMQEAFLRKASEADLGALAKKPVSTEGRNAKVKKMTAALKFQGVQFEVGDFYGKFEDGTPFAEKASDFPKRFRKPARGSSSSTPSRPSRDRGTTGEEN